MIVSDANINKKGALSFSQKQTVNGNSRYFVSLGNDKKSACTRNYDLAYELAYIVATEANIQSKKFSKDEFACAFLMPKESFIQDLKMVNDLEDYVELKKKWIVPISAIILRSYQLGEISYKKYMYLMNEMDKKGWLKKEPLEENIKATSPMLLKKSIDVLIDNNIISKASLVMNLSNWGLHLNQDEVEVLLGFKEGKLTTERNTINKKIESNIIESDNNDKNTSSTKISDEENIQNESEKVVEEFLNSYHKISSLEPQKEFKNAENLVEEELYKELEIEVIGNASMPTNGYIYRTIEKIDFTDFSFDYANKDAYIRVKVTSNWLDENKSIINKNEQTVYDFLVNSNNNEWKIVNISVEVY